MRDKTAITAILLVGMAFSAAAIGARTHAEIGRMAVDLYLKHDMMLPGLATLFDNDDNMRALYSGCAFPDWGYGLGHGAAAEYSHWHPFMERYAALLRQRYPLPWDSEAQRHIAFFFGVVSHNISDIPWHFCEDNHKSFLKAGFEMDGAGHSEIEFACDYFLYAEQALEPSISMNAWFPLDFLCKVFESSGHDVPRIALEQGTARSRAMFFGGPMVGALQRDAKRAEMPWVYAHYGDYYYGGKEHGAAITAVMTRHYYAQLTGRHYFQNTPMYAYHVRRNGDYVPRLQISETHLMAHYPDNNAGGEPFLEVGGGGDARRVGLIHVCVNTVSSDFATDTAHLWLYQRKHEKGAPEATIEAYRVLKPWRAGTGDSCEIQGARGRIAEVDEACWRHSGVATWYAPGCGMSGEDYDAVPIAAATVAAAGETGTWIHFDVTEAARYWIAHPDENHGLLLRVAENCNAPIFQFFSSHAFKDSADGLCGGTRVAFRPAFVLNCDSSPVHTGWHQ